MRKPKPIVVRTATELARALGLSPAEAVEFEVRSQLNEKVIDAVRDSGRTHAEVARAPPAHRDRD